MTIDAPGLSTVFKALGDPTRLRAVLLLRRAELTVSELTEVLDCAQSSASGVLRNLMGAELVVSRRAGRHAFYRAQAPSRWVDEALAQHQLSPDDADALARIEARRLGEDTPPVADLDSAWVPGRSWKNLARALLGLTELGCVADLGVGRGDLSLLLASTATQLYAVDPDSAALSALSARLPADLKSRVCTLCGALERVQLPEPADLVSLSLVLHGVLEPDKVIANAFGMLRPGGRLWITELRTHTQEQLAARLGHYWLGFEPNELHDWLDAAGFEDIATTAGARDRRNPHLRTLIVLARRPGDRP